MRCFFAAAAVALLTVLAPTQELAQDFVARARAEHKLALDMEGCPAVPACLAMLDAAVAPVDDGRLNEAARAISTNLQRFGESAKLELLRRAAGAHPGWRNLAGGILQYWETWSPSDVPAIRAALQLQHGGWIARPLAAIKTPEAIQALVEDLASAGAASQTGFALVQIGPDALPHLFPLLEDDRHAFAAANVIREMGRNAAVAAPGWASLAASSERPRSMRLAALRGLAAIGNGAQEQGEALRDMLADSDLAVRDQVFKTLVAIHDPSVVTTVAANCNPSGRAFERTPIESLHCVLNVVAFGEHARAAGAHLMRFLVSPNGAEVATAVTALGYTGYEPAIPEIEQQLRSADWRVVYAAARSLGWLAAASSIPELERIASGHWLPEVRNEAFAVVAALKGSEGRVARPQSVEGHDSAPRLFFFERELLQPPPACSSRQWAWRDIRFSAPPTATRVSRLQLGDGELIGTDRGEFGGGLHWKLAGAQEQVLIEDNVVAVEPTGNGAVVLFGLSHGGLTYGYAVRASQRDDGGWSLSEVARLPGRADALARIGPKLFAAWSDGRVVVFSEQGIIALAACIES